MRACRNANCKEYKYDTCARAIKHKLSISNRVQFVVYIEPRINETACNMFLDKNINDKVREG